MAVGHEVPEEDKEEDLPDDIKADGAEVRLVKALFETPVEKLAEMTNIPLDKLNALTWMRAFIKEAENFCDEIIESQRKLSKVYAKYHDGKEPDVPWLASWDEKKKKQQGQLMMAEWLHAFYQHRRSINGDHKKDAFMLAQDQIANQQGDKTENPFEEALRQ